MERNRFRIKSVHGKEEIWFTPPPYLQSAG